MRYRGSREVLHDHHLWGGHSPILATNWIHNSHIWARCVKTGIHLLIMRHCVYVLVVKKKKKCFQRSIHTPKRAEPDSFSNVLQERRQRFCREPLGVSLKTYPNPACDWIYNYIREPSYNFAKKNSNKKKEKPVLYVKYDFPSWFLELLCLLCNICVRFHSGDFYRIVRLHGWCMN